MDNQLILIAARACFASYEINTDLGSTEFALSTVQYQGKPLQVLATPGTNEFADWLWNLHLWSSEGVKRCSYKAAEKIYDSVKDRIDPLIPLMVTGHSKDAPTALWYKEKYGADYCVAFCPAPAFRRREREVLLETVTVVDPDDIVPIAGIINFGHRKVERTIKLPKDKAWYNILGRIEDHDMKNIMGYFEALGVN